MCGIVGAFHWKKSAGDANDWVKEQFSDQISRGTEGFGMLLFRKSSPVRVIRNTHIAGAFVDLKLDRAPGVLFHHRHPTSTPNMMWQTHPLFVSHAELKSDWYFVHNGIIKDPKIIHDEHIKLGYEYTTEYTEDFGSTKSIRFNDSEALAIEVVRFLEGKTSEIRATGSAAWAAIEVDPATNVAIAIHWGRNSGNPLNVELDDKEGSLHISSEGFGDPSPVGKAFRMDIATKEITDKDMIIPVYVYTYTASGPYRPRSGRKYWWEEEEELERTAAEKDGAPKEKDKKYEQAHEDVKLALAAARAEDLREASGGPADIYTQLEALSEHATDNVEAAFSQLELTLMQGTKVEGADIKAAIDIAVPAVIASIKEAAKLINAARSKANSEEATTIDDIIGEPKTEVEVVKEYLGRVGDPHTTTPYSHD